MSMVKRRIVITPLHRHRLVMNLLGYALHASAPGRLESSLPVVVMDVDSNGEELVRFGITSGLLCSVPIGWLGVVAKAVAKAKEKRECNEQA